MVTALTTVPFVGRERELSRLRARLALAGEGRGGGVLLAGEPGIGKTRLAEEFTAAAEAAGARVLWGRCLEGEGAPPFWPWIQILRAHARDRDPEMLRAELGADGADLAQIAPLLRERLPDLPLLAAAAPDPARFRLFDAFTTFLWNVAAERPLVLILDDLHQADAPSLRLLEWVARELDATRLPAGGPRLLIAGAYRDTEAGDGHPFTATLAELARLPASKRLELKGLSEPEVARVIALSDRRAPDARMASAVYAETEGNPFFVVEVLRLLAAERVPDGTAPASGIRLPPTVRVAIGRRLDRLSPEGRRLLATASVEGREFGLGVLGRVSGSAAGQVLDLIAEAEGARLIAPVAGTLDRYRFTHALIRETLYAGLAHAVRVRLHARVGEALEVLTAADPEPHLAELAHHFVQAAVVEPARAIACARRAGDQALSTLAYEEARRHYVIALRALELHPAADRPEQVEQRFELLLALGQAHNAAGSFEEARQSVFQAAAIARRLHEPKQLARAALSPGPAPANVGLVDPPTIALLEEALAGLGEDDSPERSHVMSSLAKALYSISDAAERRAALCAAATSMARRLGDPHVLADVLATAYWSLPSPAELEERLALADELVDLAAAAGVSELAFHGHGERLIEHLALGEIAALDRDLAEVERLAAEMRQIYYTISVRGFRAMRLTLQGRFAEAEQLSTLVSSDAQRMRSAVMAFGAVMLRLPLSIEQGRVNELLDAIEGLSAQVNASYLFVLCCVRLLLLSRLKRDAEVTIEIDRLAASGFRDLVRDQFMLLSIACLAEVCADRRDRVRAAALYELLLPFADRTISAWAVVCLGTAARFLGLLAATLRRWEAAACHFEHVLAKNADMGARPFLAQTQLDYATMLLERIKAEGRRMEGAAVAQSRARARNLLAEALGTARELGMLRLTAEAERLLDEINAESSSRIAHRSSLPDGLTAREVEVVRLLARRFSNNEIAAELVLSVRTVERHIANIYAKTGLHDRRGARAYAVRHGLTAPD